MSKKNPLRKDKTCLNCNYVVENRFCPNCGQENTDTRKTFHHLFIHFFEDLTHYENAFWKTIKNLLLRPASLTKEYLSGKRLSYLAPVRLYIFISFVTFLVINMFPNNDSKDFDADNADTKTKSDTIIYKEKDSLSPHELKIKELENQGILSKKEADSLKEFIKVAKEGKDKENDSYANFGYSSIKELDSVRKANPEEISDIEYWFNKKTIPLNKKYTNEELKEKFFEDARHNLPKTLFIYMPLFAFVLWAFHNKKRWYYFDHGIFTLHYFSFLLLIILILFLFKKFFNLFDDSGILSVLHSLIKLIGIVWMMYYFFPAHHRFYGETRFVSFLKSSIIFVINCFLIILLLLFFAIYTFINIH